MRAAPLLLVLSLLALPWSATASLPTGDCGGAADAGGSFDTAAPLAGSTTCRGTIALVLDEEDWYRVPVAAGEVLAIEVLPTSAIAGALPAMSLSIVGPDALTRSYCTSFPVPGVAAGDCANFAVLADTSGEWRFHLSLWSGWVVASSYEFTLTVLPPPAQNDCGSGRDATEAAPVHLGAADITCVGDRPLRSGDYDDPYTLDVLAGERLTLEVEVLPPPASNALFCLAADAGHALACDFARPIARIDGVAPVGGLWRITSHADSAFPYTIRLAHAPADPLPAQDDCGTGGDVGDSTHTAMPITPPFTCAGTLDVFSDSSDRFSLATRKGDVVTVRGHGSGQGIAMDMSRSGSCCYSARGPEAVIQFVATEDATWSLTVSAAAEERTTYTLDVDVTRALPNP